MSVVIVDGSQPLELEIGDSELEMLQETDPSLVYQPAWPSVPLRTGVITGGVGSLQVFAVGGGQVYEVGRDGVRAGAAAIVSTIPSRAAIVSSPEPASIVSSPETSGDAVPATAAVEPFGVSSPRVSPLAEPFAFSS